MENLFLLVMLGSMVALFVGLVAPKAVIRWGAEDTRTRGKVLKVYLALMVGSFIAFGVSHDASKGEQAQTSSQAQPVAAANVQVPAAEPEKIVPKLPESLTSFCNAIEQSAKEYEAMQSNGANELKLSKIRTARRNALKGILATGKVKGWTGTIKSLSTTSEGNAHLSIALPCNTEAYVQTWNNELSDVFDKTLIPQSSPVFDKVADYSKGQKVVFDGSFLKDDKDGYGEQSMSESGSLTEPEFTFRFSNVAAN